jgi:hypothetical protein
MQLPAGLTLATLESYVNNVIQQLQNAGTTLEGNGSIVIGGAASQISALLAQLKTMIGENFTKPLNDLTREIRNTSNQIYSSVARLDVMLKNQQACLLINSQVFLAGVNTITAGLKSGLPFISDDAPRIDYFQFVGFTPSIVPKNGGQINIHGFDLWEDTKYPPEVNIYEEDRKTLNTKITPQKGQDIHSFSFNLDAAFIQKNQGKILQLQVLPKEKRWLDFFGPKVLGVFFMPVAIPRLIFSKFQIIAHLQYESEIDTVDILEFKRFGMGCDSCEDRKSYSQSFGWPIPDNAQIIGIETKDFDIINQTNVQFSFSGNIITAAGWLDTATCIKGPFGIAKLLHDTHWWASAAPRISYKKKGEVVADVTTDFIELQNNEANFNIKLPKANDSDTDDTFWFELIIDNGDVKKSIFTSPNTTVDNFSANSNGLLIDAKYNGVIVDGTAQLAVKISLPNCGF